MLTIRVIPVLLLKDGGVVKTERFDNSRYIGDPVNTIRIFNEKEVDELFILDISATPAKREPDYEFIDNLAGEAFMPIAYGGGINNMDQVRKIFLSGVEKVVINCAAYNYDDLLTQAVAEYGSQAIVASIDCRRKKQGVYELFTHCGRVKQNIGLKLHLEKLSKYNVGEILVNSIDRDGTQTGYDIELLKQVTNNVQCPVVACGGAGTLDDFLVAVTQGGVSAVAAGSMFVFKGRYRAVLINYPERKALIKVFSDSKLSN